MIRHATLLPILAIASASAACAPPAAPAPAPAPHAVPAPHPSDDEGQAYDEADAVYRRGYVEEAMGRWRAMAARSSAAVARLAILENRPEAALTVPMKDDVRLLKAQARAALMLGDVGAAERALTRARTIPGAEPFAAELGSWIAAASLGRSKDVERVVSEATATVPFDAPHGVPMIEVRFGAHTERFIVDSGADVTIVDTRAAERIGVRFPAGPGTHAVSVAGTIHASEGMVDRLEALGDRAMISSTYLQIAEAFHAPFDVARPFEWTNLGMGGGRTGRARIVTGSALCVHGEPSCFDLGEVIAWDPLAEVVAALTGVEQVGVLGASAFQGRVLELDYPALRVRVRPGGARPG